MIVMQLAAFDGLIWYAIETKRMRNTAESQVEVSQNLVAAAGDQVEGLSKPCVMLASSPRNPEDAIIGPLGNSVALRMEGMFAVENIGSGPALNVRYEFIALGETARSSGPEASGMFRTFWTEIASRWPKRIRQAASSQPCVCRAPCEPPAQGGLFG